MSWFRTAKVTTTAAIPEGRRIYAVGDIHGRADLLEAMAGLIARDLDADPVQAATTIFLGDYVDRGSASATVIGRLARADFPTPIVALCGNHEDILIGMFEGEGDLDYYRQLGGDATLRSYGVDIRTLAGLDAARRRSVLELAIPPAHRAFITGAALSETVGDYFFCHAGVQPGVALDRQSRHDLLWIREEFLDSAAAFGKVVVHGHTPVRRPEVRPNRIGIDTHAFASGTLTALVLTGTERRFLQTR